MVLALFVIDMTKLEFVASIVKSILSWPTIILTITIIFHNRFGFLLDAAAQKLGDITRVRRGRTEVEFVGRGDEIREIRPGRRRGKSLPVETVEPLRDARVQIVTGEPPSPQEPPSG